MNEYGTPIDSATFTVTLGSLIDRGYDVGLSTYPLFDEEYRPTLNGKIIRHYFYREIGQETPALFAYYMDMKMREIMPYYDQLYKAMLVEIDPYRNIDMTTEGQSSGKRSETRDNSHTEQSSATSSASTSADTKGRTVVSVTPQTQLSGRDDYATNLTDAVNESATKTDGADTANRTLRENDSADASTTEDYLTRTYGLSGILQSDAIMRYRDAIMNIDMLVVEELAPLFMGLYLDYANYI